MRIEAELSQLLLIDWQPRLMPALFEGPAAVANAQRLAQAAQRLRVPTWGTEQNPDKLGPLVPELRGLCRDTLNKMSFSAVDDGLVPWLMPKASGNAKSMPKHLRANSPATEPTKPQLIVSGCEAHVCVMQTALDLLEEEHWQVWIVTDACSSRTERNRDAAWDRLASAGAELVTTEMVLFEWLRSAEHPEFKAIQGLIR